MPTTSSYYADLEYPTVNEDSSTYGTIINIYLDGLLSKLKAISDRVLNAQTQLGNINRGVTAVERINTTLASAIVESELLPSTSTTLLPDPYSGNYIKTTAWPAYTSALSSFSLPTTQAEIAAFDYEGFANALTTEVNRIEATVTQAEADILAAQKDTCRTKAIIDAIGAGDLELIENNFVIYGNSASSFTKISDNTVQVVTSTGNLSGTYALGSQGVQAYLDYYSEGQTVTILDIRPRSSGFDSDGYYNSTGSLATVSVSKSGDTYTLTTSFNAFAGMTTTTSTGYFVLATSTVQRQNLAPDYSGCDNPTPPYFS